MHPTADTTYYIKEVPADKYLQPYLHYTYHKDGGAISTAWLISDVDDLNYTQTGFVIQTGNNAAQVATSLTVQTVNGGNSIKLTAKRIFTAKGVTSGLLTYLRVIGKDWSDSNGAAANLLADGSTVLQYWVTPDGLIVTGTTSRVYTGLANKDNISKTDTDVATTINVFTAS